MSIEVGDGLLRVPTMVCLPPKTRLAVLVMEEGETEVGLGSLTDAGGAFDFLRAEPDLYTDGDVLPGRGNPRFGGSR